MADTHINAFYQDVDEALAKVKSAQNEFQAAKERLAVRLKQEEAPTDPVVQPEEQDPTVIATATTSDNDKKKK